MSNMISRGTDSVLLHNRFFSRHLAWDANGFYSDSLVNKTTGTEYCRGKESEFSFRINGKKMPSWFEPRIREVDGNPEPRSNAPEFLEAEIRRPDENTEELRLHFALKHAPANVTISYRVFREIPGFVKQLEIEALEDDIRISELVFDSFCFYPGRPCDCDYYQGTDDTLLPVNFAVEGTTDIIRCHNPLLHEGFLCGSAAPGPLRRFLGYSHWSSMDVSYSMGAVPFAKHLRKGELFRADHSFLLLYSGDRNAGESAFRALLRTVLPPQGLPQGVMYCTWLPFLKQIDEALILDLAENARSLGFRYFVLDDGWFTDDNRAVDKKKFPRGLDSLSKSIHGMGLLFGLWYNIGTTYGAPDTPDDDVCRLADGSLKKSGESKILCFASRHREKILEELSALAERYHVDYFKLDFSSILSPYAVQPYGCHSRDHAFHHSWEDSVIEMYRGLLFLRNELKKRHPELIVDFSFESFGTDRPNIAALEFSDLHHVSNLSGKEGEFQSIVKIRKLFYRWFAKLPPERILGGLLVLQNESAPEYLLSSFAGAPLVSGDLRNLPPDIRARAACFTKAFQEAADRNTLTELEILRNEDDFDAFIRKGKAGHGFVCAFNRKNEDVTLNLPSRIVCRNAETGESTLRVRANDCAMFLF